MSKLNELKATTADEAIAYCNTADIHGLGYFFSFRLSWLERIFWVSVVITMLTLSFMLVNESIVSWNANPTSTTILSTNNSASTIQFPTVTICNEFTPDKYGFARNVMNVMKFQCSILEDCMNDTYNQRAFFSWDSSFYPAFFLVPLTDPPNIYAFSPSNMISQLQNLPLSTTTFNDPNSFTCVMRLDLIHDYIVNVVNLSSPGENFPDYTNSHLNGSSKMELFLQCKLIGSCSNYDIFKYLGLDVNASLPIEFFNLEYFMVGSQVTLTDEEYNLALLTYLVLSLPLPGMLGSFAYNLKLYASSVNVYSDDDDNFDFFHKLFNTMLNDGTLDLGVSPSDIPSILNPVSTYLSRQIYSNQFRNTVTLQQVLLNMSSGDAIYTQGGGSIVSIASTNYLVGLKFLQVPESFATGNYFGKLLGPHLKQVMEVMFYSLLRTKPIDPNRFLLLKDIYGRSINDEYILTENDFGKLTTNFQQPPFYPRWKDYMAVNKTPYSWLLSSAEDSGNCLGINNIMVQAPYNDIVVFDNDPSWINSPLYNGSFDPDEIIRGLKAKYQYQNIMALCNGPGGNASCQGMFEPTLTDTGMCYTFNAMDFNSTFKNNSYTEMFQHILQPLNNNSDILLNENSGSVFQMFLVLDSHQSKVVGYLPGTFKVAISNVYGFMGFRDTAVEVSNGFFTQITVTPTQYLTTEAARSYVNCRYMNDSTLNQSIFKFYSQEACNFECRLSNSRKTCGCTPWNYPQNVVESNTEICDGPQSYCFENSMNDNYDCGCLPNCEQITFAISVTKVQINVQQECAAPKNLDLGMSHTDYDLRLIVAEKIKHMDGEEFLFWYNKINANDSSVKDDLLANNKYYRYVDPRLTVDACENYLQNDFALLSIQVGSPTFTVMVQDTATSFPEKISSIGGTLGIFTGMSILSFVEVAFLFYRIGMSIFKKSYSGGHRSKAKK